MVMLNNCCYCDTADRCNDYNLGAARVDLHCCVGGVVASFRDLFLRPVSLLTRRDSTSTDNRLVPAQRRPYLQLEESGCTPGPAARSGPRRARPRGRPGAGPAGTRPSRGSAWS